MTEDEKIKEIEKAWEDGYGMELSNDDLGKIFSYIQSLESQLNIEWDDERVKEIEKLIEKLSNINPPDRTIDSQRDVAELIQTSINTLKYILYLLKKERVEKKG